MRTPQFKKWFARLPALNLPQRLHTLAALQPAAGLAQVVALIGQLGAAALSRLRLRTIPPAWPGQWPAALPLPRMRAHL